MRSRVLAAAGLAAVVLAVAASAASAATFPVLAGSDDPPGAPPRTEPNQFFSRSVSVHVGDRVRWTFRGFHNVYFPARGTRPPSLVQPDPANPVSGLADAAGAPYWFNGQPSLVVAPNVAGPAGGTTVTGRRSVNSGLPTAMPPKPFTARFTRPGRYTYFCVVHPGMKGTVRVVPVRRRVPSPAAARAAARRQLAAAVARATALQRRAAPPAATVEVGRTSRDVSLNSFFPQNATVSVGQPVTFTMAGQTRQEVHTVTFGPEAARTQLEQTFISPGPAGTLQFNPVAAYPSDPPPFPPYTGSNHGNGLFNAGLLDNDPATPQPVSAAMTFTTPGTYQYECVIHEHMDGTITVVP